MFVISLSAREALVLLLLQAPVLACVSGLMCLTPCRCAFAGSNFLLFAPTSGCLPAYHASLHQIICKHQLSNSTADVAHRMHVRTRVQGQPTPEQWEMPRPLNDVEARMRALIAAAATSSSFLLAEDLHGTFRRLLQPCRSSAWHHLQVPNQHQILAA